MDDVEAAPTRASMFNQVVERHRTLAVATVILLALFARVVIAVQFANTNPVQVGLQEYGEIAELTFANGRMVYTPTPRVTTFIYPTAYMPPLMIFAWLFIFALCGVSSAALATMTAFNIVCGTTIVYYTMRIARRLFPASPVALGAGLLVALYPTFVFSVATYHALNLYILLLLALFDLCMDERQSIPRSTLIGVLWGLTALARTEYVVLGAAAILGALWMHRRLKLTIVTALCAAATVLPWTVRNYLVFGKVIPIANVEGYGLYKGFNPEANGSGDWHDSNQIAKRYLGPQLDQVPLDDRYEIARDEVFRQAAFTYISQHPVRSFVVLPFIKIFLFWLYDIYDPISYYKLYQLAFWPVFVLTILGLIAAWRAGMLRRPEHRTVLLLFAFQTFVMAGYAVHLRYRMTVEPFLFAYAAFGAMILWERLRGAPSSPATSQ